MCVLKHNVATRTSRATAEKNYEHANLYMSASRQKPRIRKPNYAQDVWLEQTVGCYIKDILFKIIKIGQAIKYINHTLH